MYPSNFQKWRRAFFERLCLASWMLLLMATTVAFGLSVELILIAAAFSLGGAMLVNAHTAPLLLSAVLATTAFPVVAKLREYGVKNLNFELHENALNRFVDPPESWSSVILTLLDENALRSNELTILVRLIDEAPGPVERQDRRAEAKAWLKTNRNKLTDEDQEFVNQYLGYLH